MSPDIAACSLLHRHNVDYAIMLARRFAAPLHARYAPHDADKALFPFETARAAHALLGRHQRRLSPVFYPRARNVKESLF